MVTLDGAARPDATGASGTTELIGINYFGKWPLDEALRAMRRHGYQAVDYSATAGRLAVVPDALVAVRQLTRDLGLFPAATHFRSFGFAFLRPGMRRDAFLREAVEDVRAAAFLGAPTVAFHLGNGAPPGRWATETQIAEANAETFRHVVHVAEQEGIGIALENHCHGFGDRWEHLEAVARHLDSPAVGFTLDSGHAVVAGQSPEELARNMGERLLLTHLHDNDGIEDQHRPAKRQGSNGEGEGGVIDWPALIAVLREVGYPQRNVWMLEGGCQFPGDIPDRLLAAHRVSFLRVLYRGE